MQRTAATTLAIFAALALAFTIGGCPADSTGSGGTTSDGTSDATANTQLTTEEQAALQAAERSAESLAQATSTAQGPFGEDTSQSNFSIPTVDVDTSFGACPRVTLAVSNQGALTFDLDLAFEDCQPLGSTTWTCDGSASGTFSQAAETLQVTFDSLTCDNSTLTGELDLTYDRSETQVDFNGDWDITLVDSYGTLATNGTGDASYDIENYVTSVADFQGTIQADSDSWQMVIDDIAMSFPTYQRFMPYQGEITVTGSTIRTMIVRFTSTSPTTGTVLLSVGGSPFYEQNLYVDDTETTGDGTGSDAE